MATEDLNEHHQGQMKKFLRFFRSKIEVHVKEIQGDFEDTISDRIVDEMFSRNDVIDILKSLSSATRSNARTSLQTTVNMATILVRQMFLTAEDHELEMELDMSIIEDRSLLERIQNVSLDSAVYPNSSKKLKQKSNVSDEKIKRMEKELEELRLYKEENMKEVDLKVTQSKQFKQMKTMLEQKNTQLRDLRNRLLQYEPDDVVNTSD